MSPNDSSNGANTSLLPWGDELLALLEGGSTYRLDPDSGFENRHTLQKLQIAEEPLFVAKPGTPGAGWLVGTFLDCANEESGVHVLDCDDLAAGPVALATMARHVPLGFHGCFVPG